jgi:hypothetical protein
MSVDLHLNRFFHLLYAARSIPISLTPIAPASINADHTPALLATSHVRANASSSLAATAIAPLFTIATTSNY